MNFALSQRRTDRHTVGLVIVVGLHVVLAAVLVSAKLNKSPTETPPPVVLKPLDPVVPVKPKTADLPKVIPTLPRQIVIPTPEIKPDPTPEQITGKTDDHPTKPEIVIAERGDDNTVHDQPARVVARRAVLNAGAAQCRPAYPAAAQRAGATGVSRIRFTVDALGRIAGAQILQSSGPTREHRLMDQAAAAALAQCPVTPGTDEQGRAVGGTADVEYVWNLN